MDKCNTKGETWQLLIKSNNTLRSLEINYLENNLIIINFGEINNY